VRCLAIGGCVDRTSVRALSKQVDRLEDLSAFAGSTRAACARAAWWLERLARERAAIWLR